MNHETMCKGKHEVGELMPSLLTRVFALNEG